MYIDSGVSTYRPKNPVNYSLNVNRGISKFYYYYFKDLLATVV